MKYSLLSLFLFLSLLTSQAANPAHKFSGRVINKSGEPVTWATVYIDNTRYAGATNVDGDFSINVPAGNYSGKVAAVGFKTLEFSISIKRDTTIGFTLEEDVVNLKSVSVYGKSNAKRLEEGAFAVNAVEITPNINKSITLNDIVDRTAGVKVRSEGGMGSEFDLTINGMSGNSIRYFIDGVPLETKGTGLTLETIPLNIVERVELFKGVVPSYLSSDALGGAVNIVTKKSRNNYLDLSYGIASFNTHTGDITGQYYIPGTSIVVRPTFSIKYSQNNYLMKDVEVWSEEEDRYILTNKRRFHDDYFSLFGQIEAGVNGKKWADLFFVGVSYDKVDKDIQTGAMQNKVYGDASRNSNSFNIYARYAKKWGAVSTRLNFSHTWEESETIDTTFRKYSWDGTWMPSSGNEINNGRKSIRVYKRPLTVFNSGVDYCIDEHNTVALNYMLNRSGNERSDKYDKLFEPSDDIVTKHILSFTYSQSFFNQRWQNSFFVKDYINSLSIGQTDDASITGSNNIDRHNTQSYWGAGIGTRYTIWETLAIKGSYEHSVRLPLSRELLGNGTTIYANLALSPETSNNYNLGFFGTWMVNNDHQLSYEVNGFVRHVQNYIRATVSEREGMMQYVNEPAIDIKGFDFEVSYWWRHQFQLSLNGSYTDERNLRKYKTDGNPSATYKNRVPNRPWLFGNVEASYSFNSLIDKEDRLRIGAAYQYIHWYFLNWEAFGALSTKARIPTQNLINISLTYSWAKERYNLSFECNNLFDRLAYDNYMLQKPGRSFAAKLRIYIN
ncbi:MAG: carboxypeptidase-like regulatory domain-containing protein [bacterium]|nr:carboxypeptidase-like regulatory domain-containing protein [bacterium]